MISGFFGTPRDLHQDAAAGQHENAVEHHDGHGRRDRGIAEGQDQQRHAHVAGVGEGRRQAADQQGVAPVPVKQSSGDRRGAEDQRPGAIEAAEQPPVHAVLQRRAQGLREQKRRQQEIINDVHQPRGGNFVQELFSAREIAAENEGEEGEGDADDLVHSVILLWNRRRPA
jgi:hypothetical protein